jgi:hypothetical protein
MYNTGQLRKFFRKIRVIRAPKHRLSTFGTSQIQYLLVTDVAGLPDRSRLRIGQVTAEKPAIITPQSLKQLFQGFSPEASEYADSLVAHYGQALRGLEYQFRNEPLSARIELAPPDSYIQKLIEQHDREGDYHKALIQGSDKLWELSIMKFIVEETLASFSVNFQELQDRGFFEGDNRHAQRKHAEIQNLLKRAKSDGSLVPVVGSKLKEYGLFEQYQDAFFQLLNK